MNKKYIIMAWQYSNYLNENLRVQIKEDLFLDFRDSIFPDFIDFCSYLLQELE